MRKRYTVVLSEPERARLHTLIGRGAGPARALTHARILLKANQGEAGPGLEEPLPGGVERCRGWFLSFLLLADELLRVDDWAVGHPFDPAGEVLGPAVQTL